jgi:phosphoribosyl-AMP cyclohydrolase / phosphoribosyl-ATP pyrophosphohydrolase
MVIPSIDIIEGKVVQLKQGREKVLERDDPIGLAREFSRYGEIAVIDLDAAMGKGDNEALVRELCRTAECRVGGGIRSVDKARRLVANGAAKVIVGTRAFRENGVDEEFLSELVRAVGRERIIVALDNVRGRIVVDGWKKDSGLGVDAVIKAAEPFASEFLFTRVEREGLMGGTDLAAVRSLAAATRVPVTAAGGVSTAAEIGELAALGVSVQLGMALYTGALSLSAAFGAALDWQKAGGLVPTVVQDTVSQVLMVAWSSRESLARTFETGQGWYFSRSRKRLWMKGESSGNVQEFVRIRTDCDGDTILLTVRQRGPACHTGRYSCFGDKSFSLAELGDVIRERLDHPVPGSYTASLTGARVNEKILEEAGELVEARRREDIVWEAADVLYFVCVLLAKNGIPLDDVIGELGRRRRGPRRSEEKPEAAS